MKVHIYSRSFAPAVGGTETLMGLLADEFVRSGHIVEVTTETAGEANLPYPIHRRTKHRDYLRRAKEADVILTAPLSLRRFPAQLLCGRPIFAVHPILLPETGLARATNVLKRAAALFASNIVPSHFMQQHFPRSIVIPNPFDRSQFSWPTRTAKRTDVIFVGRLVPEKGCALLLRAFADVCHAYPDARLTIIGDGSERIRLHESARELGIDHIVRFIGELIGPDLAKTMQAHGTMVVPTECEEAFGIVALEGLASGCRMVVAESGGLPEVVGELALKFRRGDQCDLARQLCVALSSSDSKPGKNEVERHLDHFTPERVANIYRIMMEWHVNIHLNGGLSSQSSAKFDIEF